MKIIKDYKYKLLVYKVKNISEVIDSEDIDDEKIYEAVIDFIFVFEHVIKKILYAKNKLLIYKFDLDIDKVNVILKDKKHTLHTIQLSEALSRYVKIFPKSKLIKHGESIEILISNRNSLEHNIDSKNIQDKEDLLGVLGSFFPVFLLEAEKVLGKLPATKIKKEKTYSEKDIQNIYESNVLSKISNYNNSFFMADPVDAPLGFNQYLYTSGDEFCPRCSNYTLSKKYKPSLNYRITFYNGDPDLYVCSKCNLELTKLEYDAVQKLKKEGKITNNPFRI